MRVPCKIKPARSNQSILKEVNPEYSLEGLMLKLIGQSNTLATLWEESTHWERKKEKTKTKKLMLGNIESKRRSGWQRIRWLDSITNSMDMNSSKLWKIVEDKLSDLLQSIGLQESNTT